MRVRVVRPLTGIIEGQPLSQFMPGFVYDLAPLLAFQLVEIRGAIEEPFPDPNDIVSDDLGHLEGPMMGGVHVVQPDSANELRSRPRRKRR